MKTARGNQEQVNFAGKQRVKKETVNNQKFHVIGVVLITKNHNNSIVPLIGKDATIILQNHRELFLGLQKQGKSTKTTTGSHPRRNWTRPGSFREWGDTSIIHQCSVQKLVKMGRICPIWHFKLGHFSNGLGQTMIILKNWHHRTDFSTSFIAILIQPIFMLLISGSTVNFFSVKNKLSFCRRFIMKQKQMKREFVATVEDLKKLKI